jgi:hypothetical protein
MHSRILLLVSLTSCISDCSAPDPECNLPPGDATRNPHGTFLPHCAATGSLILRCCCSAAQVLWSFVELQSRSAWPSMAYRVSDAKVHRFYPRCREWRGWRVDLNSHSHCAGPYCKYGVPSTCPAGPVLYGTSTGISFAITLNPVHALIDALKSEHPIRPDACFPVLPS